MKPEKQRIAIAEACGWINKMHSHLMWLDSERIWRSEPPDYLNDLNAMHEVVEYVRTTGKNQFFMFDYGESLFEVVLQRPYQESDGQLVWPGSGHAHVLIHATAPQRAEAFLRALGLWEEGEQ